MHPLIQQLVARGLEVKVTHEGYVLEGFYKSGSVRLVPHAREENILLCHQRYEEITPIANFDDLVLVNFKWWERSRTRSPGWEQPADFWLQEFLARDLITVTTKTIYEPKF